MPETYQSLPVFPLAADLGELPLQRLLIDRDALELGHGATPTLSAQEHPQRRLEFTAWARNASEVALLEAFLKSLRGRHTTFWVPAWTEDLRIAEAVKESAIRIEHAGLAGTLPLMPGRYVALCDDSGTWHRRSIINAVEWTPDPNNLRHFGVTGEVVTLDSALPEPVKPRWTLSRLLLCRLVDDEIELSFLAENLARLDFACVEVPTAYPDPQAEALQRPVFLYRIVKRVAVTELYALRLTSYGEAITAGGETWQPMPLEHGDLAVSTDGEDDSAEVRLYAWPGNPFEDWLPHTGQPVTIEILQSSIAADGTLTEPVSLFRGRVERVRRQGIEITCTLGSPLAFADRRVPRVLIQTRCSHQLYEPYTCKAFRDSFRVNGVILVADAATGTIDLQSSALDGLPADWLAYGYLQTGAPPDTQLRGIRKTEALAADTHRLYLSWPLKGDVVGESVSAWPGCDHTPTHCQAKFDNFANYGGHPFLPSENPAIQAVQNREQNTGGGKK